MVANIDYNMGRLDGRLRELNLRDNTIVIYFSDNGGTKNTMQNTVGMKGAKTELYEGGHRVPFFIRWPGGGVQGGRDSDVLAHVQDVFPTLIELCALKRPAKAVFDGVSLARLMRGQAETLPDRTLIVQFSRMNDPRPKKDDAAVMWKKWRLVHGKELYDLAHDPGQETNVFEKNPAIVSRLQKHYDGWWKTVEPHLDHFLPVHVGSEHENPTMLSACEWADVFLDQGGQVRRGEKKNGAWHIHVEKEGNYEIALRRWPRDCDAGIGEGIPEHKGEDGVYAAGVALPIAGARLQVGAFEKSIKLAASDREAVFRTRLWPGPAKMQTWFLDKNGEPLLGAYYAYVTLV